MFLTLPRPTRPCAIRPLATPSSCSPTPCSIHHHIPTALLCFLFFKHAWLISASGPLYMLFCLVVHPYLLVVSLVNPRQVSAQMSPLPRGLPWSSCLEYVCVPQFMVCLPHQNVNSSRAGSLVHCSIPQT